MKSVKFKRMRARVRIWHIIQNNYVQHFLFWCFVWLIVFFVFSSVSKDSSVSVMTVNTTFYCLLTAIPVYIIHVSIFKFRFHEKIAGALFSTEEEKGFSFYVVLGMCLLGGLISYGILVVVFEQWNSNFEDYKMLRRRNGDSVLGQPYLIFVLLLLMLCTAGITRARLLIEEFRARKRRERQEGIQQKRKIEWQLRPHFVFNTLYNIKILTRSELRKTQMQLDIAREVLANQRLLEQNMGDLGVSDEALKKINLTTYLAENKSLEEVLAPLKSPIKAHQLIGDFAELYRFVLMYGDKTFVPLALAVQFLEGYIDLASYSLSTDVDFKYELEGIISENQKITPLALQVLAENCFKHYRKINHPFIHIHLIIENERLFLTTKNSYDPHKEDRKQKKGEKKSIGWNAIQQQLEAVYPEQFELKRIEGEHVFEAYLSLPLKKFKPK